MNPLTAIPHQAACTAANLVYRMNRYSYRFFLRKNKKEIEEV